MALVRRKTGKNAARKRIKTDSVQSSSNNAFQCLYGGQFTLSTLLINQIFVYYHTGFLGNLILAKGEATIDCKGRFKPGRETGPDCGCSDVSSVSPSSERIVNNFCTYCSNFERNPS